MFSKNQTAENQNNSSLKLSEQVPQQNIQGSSSIQSEKQLSYFENEQDLRQFFQKNANSKYHYLTYSEYLNIFGAHINPNQIKELNKDSIKVHLEYFNYCYNASYKEKWYPLYALFLFNSIRFRSTSLIGSAAYLFLYDYYFETYNLHSHKEERIIKINKAFDYHLVKRKYQSIRYKQSQDYTDQINRNISQGVYENEENLNLKSKNVIKFGAKKMEDLDRDFKEFLELEKEQEQEQQQYKFKQNNFTKTVQSIVQDFWFYYIDHPTNTQNIKDKFEHLFSTKNIEQQKSNLKQFHQKFLTYKEDYGFFPNRKDFQIMTTYKEINQDKVYNLKQMVRDQAELTYETINYIIFGKTDKAEFPLKLFYFGEFDKDLRPKYRLDTFVPQLLTFTLFCIIPSKILFRSKSVFQYASQQYKKQKMMQGPGVRKTI